jgi:hypothetical protein
VAVRHRRVRPVRELIVTVVASWPPPSDSIVIELDVRKGGWYVSAECQLGAHHGCPGGLWDQSGARALVCLCGSAGCSCSRNLPGTE